MMKLLDIPPVWLCLAMTLAWLQAKFLHLGLLASPVMMVVGWALLAMGLVLTLAAAWAFWRHKTTIMPNQTPKHIIQSGVFSITRNPIYLGDALILAGLCLAWGAFPALVLVPAFIWWITVHFIVGEEARMRAAFGDAYSDYEDKVRRWV